MKRCYACGETKPLDAFALARRRYDGRQAACRACRSIHRKQWLARNPEMHASYQAARRQAQRRRMPWFDHAEVQRYYRTAAELRAIGLDVHVDHWIALRSRVACGLHVAANLRLAFSQDNVRKGARMPDDPAAPGPLPGQFRRLPFAV